MNKKKQRLFILITVLPGLLATLIFMIYPAIKMFFLSFFSVSSMLNGKKFVGLENYIYMFQDENFIKSLKNTFFIILVYPAILLTISVILAVLVTQTNVKGKAFFRVLFFFPSIMSMILTGIIWYFIYHPTYGILNSFLSGIGLGGLAKPWLGDPKYAMWAVIIVMLWQGAGYYMFMYVAGIDRIPKVLYEAASIDGAAKLKQFFVITLPFLWDIVRMTIVFAIGGAINVGFIVTMIMTDGGPSFSTTVTLKYIQKQAFERSNFGYAMAMSVIMLIISFGIAMISRKVTENESIES